MIKTPRLFLREFIAEDAESFYKLNADIEVIQYTGDPPFADIAEAKSFIRNYNAYRHTGMGRWATIEAATGDFIGFCGLKKHEDGEVDLGYRLMKSTWGKGYATEAAKACIAYAFDTLDLNSLIGRVAKKNLSSIRVLEKCDFHREAEAPCDALPGWRYRLFKP
ncbi:MAG: GNAT family N-acetyltransferase [Bacteroidia bacterium]